MAVLQELQLHGFSHPQATDAKQILAAAFWGWFHQHGEDVAFSTKIFGFIRIEIKVKQLEPVFVRIFGSRA